MKPAFVISLGCALLAFLFAPTSVRAEAVLRATVVFTGVFFWSLVALTIMRRTMPAGKSLLSDGGPRPEGSGENKFVDLSKQTVDRSKLLDLLR